MSLRLTFRCVQYGYHVRFYGLTIIKRAAKSKIVIGDNCIFRSLSCSNLIGIDRHCILTALGSNANLVIGNDCGFSGTVIGCFHQIVLGNKVRCGANTLITDSDWHLDDLRSSQPEPIFIEDNVWLGVNVIVLKGVTIGKNSIIGAGSIVTKDIPPDSVAGGNPCIVLKKL